jgi:hypothetical protein
MRGKYRKYRGNPFDNGCKLNCKDFWSKKKSRVLDGNRKDNAVENNKLSDSEDNQYEIKDRIVDKDVLDKIR